MSKLDISKFPGLKFQLDQLDNKKALIDLLTQRKELINDNNYALTSFEKNERLILLNKTNMELAKLHKIVIEEKQKIDKYIESLTKLTKDCETDYSKTLLEFLEVFAEEKGFIDWYNSVKDDNEFIAKLDRFDKMRSAIKNKKDNSEKTISPESAYDLVMQIKDFYAPYFEKNTLRIV
jgi:hypothetical protein